MRCLLLAALTLTASVFAQSFDVATVKKSDEPQPGKPVFFGTRGGPGTDDPGRLTWSNANLRSLLTEAYDVKPFQIEGPDWIDGERFEIVANVPAGTTKEQLHVMWQHLLADRFGVVLHHSSKVMQAYVMEAVKGGVKLQPTTLDTKATDSQPPAGPPQMDKNGVPQFTRPGNFMQLTMGPSGPTARLIGKALATDQLAEMLSNQLEHPVLDKTGLTDKYDFALEFTLDPRSGMAAIGLPGPLPTGGPPPQTSGASEPGSNLASAVQQQLGLKLTSTKAPMDILVIDKAEKTPTEN